MGPGSQGPGSQSAGGQNPNYDNCQPADTAWMHLEDQSFVMFYFSDSAKQQFANPSPTPFSL